MLPVELTPRKKIILSEIVKAHIEHGEPVGSKFLCEVTNLGLSSATIRNEMSDLCDMGYLEQPHTSAGRIPSDKGYRLYVDTMMEEKERELEELKEMCRDKAMIAVTAATCPDHYCMHRGFCDRGTQIVCLPNRLVIRFLGEQNIDAVAG